MKQFTHKQISAQSGLSLATIDRALHKRGKVHPQTEHRIRQAIADLELQQKASLAKGRTIFIDVILHTPERFSELVREAFVSQISSFISFRIQLRFHCFENLSITEMKALIKKCAMDSHGMVLKLQRSPDILPIIEGLIRQRVPVVTIVTDIPESARLRYIGMDNYSAGKAAALMMSKWLASDEAVIAAITGSQDFIGEMERCEGFIKTLARLKPGCRILQLAGGYGIDHLMYEYVSRALESRKDISAVYTVGGGNAGILRAFDEHHLQIDTFIGHDLDRENKALMQAGKIDVLIEHNLQLDAQNALKVLLEFHSFLPGEDIKNLYSKVNIITRYNMYS